MNDNFVRAILIEPRTYRCSMAKLEQAEEDSIRYPDGYWLNDVVANKEFGDVLEILKKEYGIRDISLEQDESGCVHLMCEFGRYALDINFANGFPDMPPEVRRNGLQVPLERGAFFDSNHPIKGWILQTINSLQNERN
jgi:hypothetical protein